MYQQIDFTDGNFEMVLLPMVQHPLVSVLRDRMRLQFPAQMSWHPEMDSLLYNRLVIYYQKIAACLVPTFDVDRLTPVSRFRFFICSEPIETEHGYLPGLSQLDQLLGYSYNHPIADPNKPAKAVITSGNPIVDLTAELLLVLKSDARWLMEQYSVEFLSQMLTQMAQRQDPEAQQRLQKEKDQEYFERANVDTALKEHYEKLGIPVPNDF